MNQIQEINLSDLFIPISSTRTENVSDGISDLVEHIEINGLLEPIIVFKVDEIDKSNELYETHKDFKGKYLILIGQRRFWAFNILNKKSSGNKWEKIPCIVRAPPKNNFERKSISLGSNITQHPMPLADIIYACDELFMVYNNEKIVHKTTGISTNLIKRYVKFNRLPDLLKDNLQMIHKNNKTAVNIAVEAADALGWSKSGSISEENVLELAKALGDAKSKSIERYKKLKQSAEENPSKSLAEIQSYSEKIKNSTIYKIVLDAKYSSILEKLSEKNGRDPNEELTYWFESFIEELIPDDN